MASNAQAMDITVGQKDNLEVAIGTLAASKRSVGPLQALARPHTPVSVMLATADY